MAIGLRPGAEHEIVLKADLDLPEADRTTFVIGMLTSSQRSEFLQLLRRAEKDDAATLKAVFETVGAGLKGWKNFRDEHGEEILFRAVRGTALGSECKRPDEATMSALDIEQMQEIAAAIWKRSKLGDDEKKD